MNTVNVLRQMDEVTNRYLEELSGLSEDQLRRQPSETEWSIGQMYVHLFRSALHLHLLQIELCRDGGDGVEAGGSKTERGEAVFDQGGFPDIRIQVPASPQYTPPQPESKAQLVEGLNAARNRMKELEPILEEIPPQRTTRHPGLGALNAKEWFALVEMHYRHHLRQLERLKQFLAIGA